MSSKNIFLFAGQGSQFIGMGKDLYDNFDIAKEYFDLAEGLVPDLKAVCFEGPEDKLKLTKYTQPGIFTVSAVFDVLLKEKGIKPEAVAGFSLGEYAALFSAGIFDFKTGIKLVKVRGEAMTEACESNPGTMAAVLGLEDQIIEEVCKEITDKGELVIPVNYNSPGQLVVSGTKKGVEEAVEILEEKEAKRAVVLAVNGAFHSPLMENAKEKLKEVIDNAEMKQPEIPVIMNAVAEEVNDLERVKELMLTQLTSAVLWKQSINKLIEKGYNTFYELGPGRVLSGFMRSINREVTISNFQKQEDLEKLNS